MRDFYKTRASRRLLLTGETEHWLWQMGSAKMPDADLIQVQWET